MSREKQISNSCYMFLKCTETSSSDVTLFTPSWSKVVRSAAFFGQFDCEVLIFMWTPPLYPIKSYFYFILTPSWALSRTHLLIHLFPARFLNPPSPHYHSALWNKALLGSYFNSHVLQTQTRASSLLLFVPESWTLLWEAENGAEGVFHDAAGCL